MLLLTKSVCPTNMKDVKSETSMTHVTFYDRFLSHINYLKVFVNFLTGDDYFKTL